MLVGMGTWPGRRCQHSQPHEIDIRTDDLIRSNLAPFPGFSLIGFLDQVDLRIVEDLVSPGRRNARIVLAQGRIDLDVFLEAKHSDSIIL